MNNKGFTLIELLVTIALLAVLSIISFVSINAVIEKSRKNDCNSLKENIKSAAKEYLSDNRYKNNLAMTGSISTATLINNNYLTDQITNPFTKKQITGQITIAYTLNANYTVKTITVSGTGDASFINDCTG